MADTEALRTEFKVYSKIIILILFLLLFLNFLHQIYEHYSYRHGASKRIDEKTLIGAIMRVLEYEILPVLVLYTIAIFTVSLVLPGLIFVLLLAGGMACSVIGYRVDGKWFKLVGKGLSGLCGVVVLISAMPNVDFAKLSSYA